MKARKCLTVALVSGLLGMTVSAALAGPLMLGPISAPVMPRLLAVPLVQVTVQPQFLNMYRQVRTFWLSRAIVR